MSLATHEWLPDPERLPVALLIHGMGGDGESWYKLAEHLVDLGYRVVAPDLSGHGDSPRLETYSVNHWVNEVAELLRQFPEPELIVGHSLGGLIATGVAPRLKRVPKRVILVDPAWVIPPSAPAAFVISKVLSLARYSTTASLRRTKPKWSEKDIELELAAIKKWDPKAGSGLSSQETRQILDAYLKAKIPTTLVRPNGSLMVFGPWARALAKRYGIEVRSLPKVSHTLHRDDPVAFLQAIDHYLLPTGPQAN